MACLSIVAVVFPACAARVPPVDEQVIRRRADAEEATLLKRVRLYQDPGVARYLSEIVGRLSAAGAGPAGTVKVAVIEDPSINAFVLPNGHLFIHTGLLSLLRSEAQLATILARELARHLDRDASPVAPRAGRSPMVHVTLGPTAAAILGRDLALAAAAAIDGYGPALERGADAAGVKRLAAAGYDARGAPEVFRLLGGEGAGRGPLEIFFYGNRSRMAERYASILALLPTSASATAEATGRARPGDDELERTMRPLVRDNAALDARAGRIELARRQLDRVIAATPDDPIAQLHYGDLYRLLAQRAPDASTRTDDTRNAMERYERAIELDPRYADPFRQVGLLHYEARDTAQARRAFETYLVLRPDAADARRIREYIEILH